MQGKTKKKLEQINEIQKKEFVYRFSPRSYIKMNGIPLVESGFDEDEVRYYFSEQTVLRTNVAVKLPIPEFNQRDVKPNSQGKGIGLEHKERLKLKEKAVNNQGNLVFNNHNQNYLKILQERNLKIIQPLNIKKSQIAGQQQKERIQQLKDRNDPREMVFQLDQNRYFVNSYQKYLPISKPTKKILFKNRKVSRLEINQLTRREHMELNEKKPVSFHLDKEYWMRQLHVRFFRSLIPAPAGGGVLQIDTYQKDKNKSKRLNLLRVWVQVGLTPIKFKTWQTMVLSVVLGFIAATSICLLVMIKDMPTDPIKIGPEVYDIYYNNEMIGTTANRVGTKIAYDFIQKDLSEALGMEVELKHELEFQPSQMIPENPDSGQRALAGIADSLEYEVYAIEIKMDGKSVGVVKDKKSAEQVLESLKKPFIDAISKDVVDWSVIGFKENITFEPAFVEKEIIKTNDDIVQQLMKVDQEKQTVIVKSGDSVSGIAQKYDLKTETLMGLNPEIGSNYRLDIGDELTVVQPNYQYTVLTKETVEYKQTIEYETEYIKDNSMYTTQTKIITCGALGEVAVVANINKENGVEIERDVVSESMLKEPINEVVRIGTKEPALFIEQSAGTGIIGWPTTGTVSSEFGPRWGRMHSGIDIANSSGTPIYAADTGTVTYSAYHSGGYGNLIKIYHGDGIETRYGHMVKRVAKQGEQVEKGQLIGYMGTTGHSTGNHLHFEVRVGGVAKNPRNFLN